jgi:hypothetical protein
MATEYEVKLYATPMPLPLYGSVHTYFTAAHAQHIDRIEVLGFLPQSHPARYYEEIFKNYLPPETGFRVISEVLGEFPSLPRMPSRCIGVCRGGVGTTAEQLYTLLTTAAVTQYPGAGHYRMVRGPNSNTFSQWIIDQYSADELRLPWNAWGKHDAWCTTKGA